MYKIKIILLILSSNLILSCGFHLRGIEDLSSILPELRIQGVSIHSEFGRELYRGLSAAKINVLQESEVVLEISRNEFSKRVLSLDAAGRANQYELNYLISFKLTKNSNEKISGLKNTLSNNNSANVKQSGNTKEIITSLIPQQTVSARREFFYDATQVLAKADEENRLVTDMRQTMAQQLIRRISFSLKSTKNSKSRAEAEIESEKSNDPVEIK